MTSRDESLRALADWCSDRQVHWAAQGGDYAQGRVNAFCEAEYEIRQHLDALLSDRQEVAPVAWLIRDRKTKVVWMDENSQFGSESEATICAMDMNEEIDDADFEAFAVYTSTGQTSDARDAQDAARYRFLIPALYRDDFTVGEAAIQLHTVGPCPTVDDVAAAIDAAMEAK